MRHRMRVSSAVALAAVVVGGGFWSVTTGSLPVARAQEAFAVAREIRVGPHSVGAVYVNGRLVIRLRDSRQGGRGTAQAEAVARRLNDLNADRVLTAEALQVKEVGNSAIIVAGDDLIVAVDPEQARLASSTPLGLARVWRDHLRAALGEGASGLQAPGEKAPPREGDHTAVVSTGRGETALRQERGSQVRLALLGQPEEETRTKIVPILTVGSSLRVGVAQVTGPVSRVDEVKAVARLDTDYKDAVRIAILVPVASENVVSNIRRVPKVSISAVGDLKL